MDKVTIRLDRDTREILTDLIDLDEAKNGKTNMSRVVIDSLRDKHRKEFPDMWVRGVYKHYKTTA